MRAVSRWIALCVALASAGGAEAQESAPPGPWEVEVRGGVFIVTNPTGGTLTLPPDGGPLTLASGTPGRRVSSWMFGDGAGILNQIVGTANRFNQVRPLDPLLASAMTADGNGGGVGIRVSRAVTQRVAAELTVDYTPSSAAITRSARDGLDRVPDSVYGALAFAIRNDGPSFVSDRQRIVRNGGTGQVLTAAALKVAVAPRRRATPFLTGGVGVVSRSSEGPVADLSVRAMMRFRKGGEFAIDETDHVVVRAREPRRSVVGVIGAGVDVQPTVRVWRGRAENTSRWGIRVEGRVFVGGRVARTTLSAEPSRVTATEALGPGAPQAAGVTVIEGSPGIQFSNDPALTGFESTLSGPPLTDVTVFTGRGIRYRVLITSGLFVRF